MLSRLISTIILWTITILAIIYGKSIGWTLVIMILSAGASYEACVLLEHLNLKPMKMAVQVFNVLIFASAWCASEFEILNYTAGSLVFALTTVSLLLLIVKSPYTSFTEKSIVPTIAVTLMIPFMLHWFTVLGVELRSSVSVYTGIMFGIWILSAAKFSDVGAYVIGSAFGRHKMSPDISPNKTWEGVIGGLCSSASISATIAWCGSDILPKEFTPLLAATLGVVIGFIAIISDLLESVLKRRADVKDSGKFIPGIGGALDLADSLLLTAPIGALMIFIIL